MNKINMGAVTVILNLNMIAFGQSTGVTTVSVASYKPIVAPDSIVAAWGSNLAPSTFTANSSSPDGQPVVLPLTLGPVSLSIKDSGGNTIQPTLYMVSSGQINYLVPATAKLGPATLTVNTGTATFTGPVSISNVAPALFSADASGMGVALGNVVRVTTGGVVTNDTIFQGTGTLTPKPINLTLSPTDGVYLVLYGTGIRRRSLNPVIATIGGIRVPVLYAGAQSQYPGFDQVNIGPLPASLVGKGVTDLILTVDGVPANTLKLSVQ